MKVSVVIPVYNAELFLEKAVESALMQEETAEILLVEDGSLDGSFDVCTRLEHEHESVILIRHPDGGNHGAGAARNLGIKSASSSFIAFLDADDLYLPGRFGTAREIFTEQPGADGVYEATGTMYENPEAKARWLNFGEKDITTLSSRVRPEELADLLLDDCGGTIHLDALTVKRTIFDKSGFFPEHLRLHQDTALVIQMALLARLYPGSLDTPVATRRVHSGNRFIADYNRYRTNYLLWKTLFRWASVDRVGKGAAAKLFLQYLHYTWCLASGRHSSEPPEVARVLELLSETLCHPVLAVLAVREHTRKITRVDAL